MYRLQNKWLYLPYDKATWWYNVAKDVNSIPSASTNPPTTAVNRVDLRRHNAIITGALNIETAQLAAPSQSVDETMKMNKPNIEYNWIEWTHKFWSWNFIIFQNDKQIEQKTGKTKHQE